jgi:hypothetical protein
MLGVFGERLSRLRVNHVRGEKTAEFMACAGVTSY